MSDPVKAIVRRLRRRCADWAEIELDHGTTEAWNSLLFDGGRHRIDLRLRGAAVATALDALPAELDAADFTIPGHLIAELRLVHQEHGDGEATVQLEALTIAADRAISV
jgi:hypothetical protein